MNTTHLLTIGIDDTADPRVAGELAEVVHRMIPGSHTVNSVPIETSFTDFEWDDNGLPMLPLDADDAQMLVDDQGFLTIVTTVDQDEFMTQRAYGMTTEGADDEHDLLHNTVFSFGLPYDATTLILAVQGTDFVVQYTTKIGEFISSSDNDLKE